MRTLSAMLTCLMSWSAAILIGGGVIAREGLPIEAGANGKPASIAPPPSVPARSTKPRLLVLPWLVLDRTTDQCVSGPGHSSAPSGDEAQRLSLSAMAALDAVLHRHGGLGEMVQRAEWLPYWEEATSDDCVRQGPGCASCTPAGDLLRYDRVRLQGLGQAARGDYIFLGITVVPLTGDSGGARPDACCREALTLERDAVLARSSVLLVRVRDGETIWQRDARRLDRDVLRRSSRPIYPSPSGSPPPMDSPLPGPVPDMRQPPEAPVWIIYTPEQRREMAVDETAHMLGWSFLRVHREVMR
jgi:hypothetical protein